MGMGSKERLRRRNTTGEDRQMAIIHGKIFASSVAITGNVPIHIAPDRYRSVTAGSFPMVSGWQLSLFAPMPSTLEIRADDGSVIEIIPTKITNGYVKFIESAPQHK